MFLEKEVIFHLFLFNSTFTDKNLIIGIIEDKVGTYLRMYHGKPFGLSMRDLVKKLPREMKTKVRLEHLKFIIHYLHTS
jgi:hypothetical protein